MPSSPRPLDSVPVGTKYVLERQGPFVCRYIEFPSGRRLHLPTRKALSCSTPARQKLSIVPNQDAARVAVLALRKRERV